MTQACLQLLLPTVQHSCAVRHTVLCVTLCCAVRHICASKAVIPWQQPSMPGGEPAWRLATLLVAVVSAAGHAISMRGRPCHLASHALVLVGWRMHSAVHLHLICLSNHSTAPGFRQPSQSLVNAAAQALSTVVFTCKWSSGKSLTRGWLHTSSALTVGI